MENMLINCAACGERVSLSAKACPKCGHPVTAAQRAQASQLLYSGRQRVGHGMGRAGLGCGIPGLIFFWFPFVGPPLIVLSFLFSVLGIALGKKKGAAVTGLVFSILGIVAIIVALSLLGSLPDIGDFFGSDEVKRGELVLGDQCVYSQECSMGSICSSYNGGPKQCYEICLMDDPTCGSGYTCAPSSQPTGSKKTKFRAICVEDSKL